MKKNFLKKFLLIFNSAHFFAKIVHISYIFYNYSTKYVQCQVKEVGKLIEIGKKLKELRQSENLTQQELAEKLGIGRVNYTRYETGAARPDYETLIKLADFYDVSLDELFDRR